MKLIDVEAIGEETGPDNALPDEKDDEKKILDIFISSANPQLQRMRLAWLLRDERRTAYNAGRACSETPWRDLAEEAIEWIRPDSDGAVEMISRVRAALKASASPTGSEGT